MPVIIYAEKNISFKPIRTNLATETISFMINPLWTSSQLYEYIRLKATEYFGGLLNFELVNAHQNIPNCNAEDAPALNCDDVQLYTLFGYNLNVSFYIRPIILPQITNENNILEIDVYFKTIPTGDTCYFKINPNWTFSYLKEYLRFQVAKEFNVYNFEIVEAGQNILNVNSFDTPAIIIDETQLYEKYGYTLNVAFYIRPIVDEFNNLQKRITFKVIGASDTQLIMIYPGWSLNEFLSYLKIAIPYYFNILSPFEILNSDGSTPSVVVGNDMLLSDKYGRELNTAFYINTF